MNTLAYAFYRGAPFGKPAEMEHTETSSERAFDPLNPAHTELLMTLMNMDLRYVLNNLQQAQQYRQEQQQYRQQIGSELSILPPQGAFPGGPEYLEAQQIIGGRYGMRM